MTSRCRTQTTTSRSSRRAMSTTTFIRSGSRQAEYGQAYNNQGYPPQSYNNSRSRGGRGHSFGQGGNHQGYQGKYPDYSNPNHMRLGQPQQKPQQQHPAASIPPQNTQQLVGFAPIDFEKLSKPILRDPGVYTTPMKIPAECYESIERGVTASIVHSMPMLWFSCW